MLEGKTKSGFSFSIEDNVLDDMRLVDALAEIDANPMAISKVVQLLLGDQRNALYAHLARDDGSVPVEAVVEAVMDIFQAGDKRAKN